MQDACDGPDWSVLQNQLRKVRDDGEDTQLDHILGFKCVLQTNANEAVIKGIGSIRAGLITNPSLQLCVPPRCCSPPR